MNVNNSHLENVNTVIIANNISLSVSDAEKEPYREENLVQSGMEEDQFRREKRDRGDNFVGDDDDNEGWNLVKSKEKRLKPQLKADIEMYLSSNEKLLKQFALAKMLKACGIVDIIRIKYINPFKICIKVCSELSADKIEKCQEFKDKGWKTQVRDLQGKQDEYMTKKDFEKYVDKENNLDTLYGETRKMKPCVNNRRGGFCLQDSYDSTSGPMGLMTDLGNDTPPSIFMQERVIAHASPSYARAAAVATGEPLSVAPGQKRQHVEAHREKEAHCGDQECTSHVPNVEAVARAPPSPSSLPAVAAVSREIITGGDGEAEIQNNCEGEWVQVVRRPDFVQSFLLRHKNDISQRVCENIKHVRAKVSPDTIKEHFIELEKSLSGVYF
ncbi:unnamed protein product [Parnassius apollo]|uniref:(apollo) hypothetical protein n=1 Tax=Parnassius apollo TaxID=110799 RepID=A0A8S3WCM4_PARAO|nr:unnamed protein product [Parnassius apollo]